MVMHEHDAIVNPETHHERSDVNVRALIWFVVIFIVFSIITHILLWLMFKGFASLASGGATNAPLTSVLRPADAAVPQEPRLQPFPDRDEHGAVRAPYQLTPQVDLALMRAREDEALNNPGWVDQQKGVVRLPIEVAKQIALQRIQTVSPTPVAPQGGAPAAAPAGTPAASPAPSTSTGAAH